MKRYTVTELADTIDGEDPFVYADPRDAPGVLHALSHAGGWDPSGGHAWSTDAGESLSTAAVDGDGYVCVGDRTRSASSGLRWHRLLSGVCEGSSFHTLSYASGEKTWSRDDDDGRRWPSSEWVV